MPRVKYAPKLQVGLIARLYRSDALGLRDEELVDDVGWRLHARCGSLLLVGSSQVVCPECMTRFDVPWRGEPGDRSAVCPGCGWTITAAEYHASWRHQDLWGALDTPAFETFVAAFPTAHGCTEKMLLIDRLVHAVHKTGGLAARNLFEGRPRQVIAMLDDLASTP